MLRAGHVQQLTVSRISEHGLFLADEEQQEVLLPNRYVSLADKVGDTKEVFVYHDSEDRLVATTETPLLKAGEAGYLKVVDKTEHGAFLDWGLYGKDLFLPNRNQQGGVLPGRSYIVYLYEDNITGRCVATMKLKGFINNDIITVAPRQAVELLVASESPIGYRPLNDASAPEEVAARTQMSKKVFKRSLGMLLKRGEVEMTEQGIKLRKGK